MIINAANLDVLILVVYVGVVTLEYLASSDKFETEKTFAQFGIIFLDINMPRMNGWEFLQKYEKLPHAQKGRIVMAMLTSSSNSDDIRKAEDMNELTDYIMKPLKPDLLEKIIVENFNE